MTSQNSRSNLTTPVAILPVARSTRWLLAGSLGLSLLVVGLVCSNAAAATAWTMVVAALLAVALVGSVLRRSAAERALLQVEVDRQAKRLAQWAVSQARFVDSIAHEIKTPLTIVTNHAELLLRCSEDPAAVRGHAKSLADYTLHFADLIDGFLRLGGPAAVADHGQHTPMHVNDLVIEAVRRCQSAARGRGVVVVVTIPEPEDASAALEVVGNEALLRAVAESLVRHAIRASWRGARVMVQVATRGDSVLLHVRHHGRSIAEADLETVFDWFFLEAGAGPTNHGSGAGLAVGKRIVEHHRGTITVHNHAAGGCEFVVTLPRWRGEAEPPSGTGSPDPTPPIAPPA